MRGAKLSRLQSVSLQCSMDHGLAFWLTAPAAGLPSGDGPIEISRRLEGEPKMVFGNFEAGSKHGDILHACGC